MGLFSNVIPDVVKAATTPAAPPATVSPDYGTGLPEPYIPGYSPPRPGIEAPPVYTYAQPQSPGYAPVDIPLSYAQQPSVTPPSQAPGSEQAVTDVFNKYFGRAPAKEGLEYWTKQVGPTLEPQERDWILSSAAPSDQAYMQRNYPAYWTTPDRPPARAPSESAGGPMDIGTFTPSNVVSTTPRLNTNIAYNVGPSLSQMYADQLARETGARGLREDEIQAAVRSGYEAIGRGTDMIDPEGAAYWERQLRTGAVSPGDLAAKMGQSVLDEANMPTVRTFEPGEDQWGRGEISYEASAIPENFDWQAYVGRSGNADLLRAGIDTEEEARRHYAMYGANEGRKYTPITQEETDQALAAMGPATRASYDYYNRMGTWGQSGLPTYGPSPSRASFIRGMGQDELGETVLTDTLTGGNVLPSGTVSPDGTTTASGATMFTTVPMSANDLYSSFFDNPNSFLTGQSNALSPYVTRTTNPQYDDENACSMQQRGIPQYNYSMSKDQYDKAVEAGVINPNEYKYDEVGKQILRVAKFAQGGAVNADPTMAFINRQAPAARRAGVTPKQVQKAQDFLAFAQSKRFGI